MRVCRSLIAVRAKCLLPPLQRLPPTGNAHPRCYGGETGTVNMRPWLNLHLPSSRDTVPTGYGYVLPDQNGWSRYLHFQAAWLAVGTGLLYVLFCFFRGDFWRNL